MKKLGFIFVFALAVSPLCAQTAQSQDDYYTGYEGLVLGESAPRSATDAIAQQATQVPGDIYRGTLFGAEQKKYEGDTLGNRPRPTTKYVYDTSLVRAVKISDPDRVRTLMYANVDVNEKNYAGITPLTIAAEKGNMKNHQNVGRRWKSNHQRQIQLRRYPAYCRRRGGEWGGRFLFSGTRSRRKR